MDAAPVKPGDLIATKYVIDRVLGSGGMGVVVAAKHLELDQPVAIKFLLEEAFEDPSATERFLREARAAAQIHSEHGARVLDVGRLETGAPYMVMEYLDGIDLATELKRRGALPPREAVSYVLQAMEALAEAHAVDIVHRDLKPANLFLTTRKDGSRCLKVLDFGISKVVPGALAEDDAYLTLTSAMLGSPQYMAPEQVRDAKAVDMRADIWSLGIILYECLSGELPFQGEMLSGVLAAIVADPPRPLKEVRLDIPSDLAAVVAECLQKDPKKRVQNVSDLAYLLGECEPEASPISLGRIYSVMGDPKVRSKSTFAKTASAGRVNVAVISPGEGAESRTETAITQVSAGPTVPPVELSLKTPRAGTPRAAQERNLWKRMAVAVFVVGLAAAAASRLVIASGDSEEGVTEAASHERVAAALSEEPKGTPQASSASPLVPDEESGDVLPEDGWSKTRPVAPVQPSPIRVRTGLNLSTSQADIKLPEAQAPEGPTSADTVPKAGEKPTPEHPTSAPDADPLADRH